MSMPGYCKSRTVWIWTNMQEKSTNRYRSFCRSLENLKDARGRDL